MKKMNRFLLRTYDTKYISALGNRLTSSRDRGERKGECESQSMNGKQINFRLLEDTTTAAHFIHATSQRRVLDAKERCNAFVPLWAFGTRIASGSTSVTSKCNNVGGHGLCGIDFIKSSELCLTFSSNGLTMYAEFSHAIMNVFCAQSSVSSICTVPHGFMGLQFK